MIRRYSAALVHQGCAQNFHQPSSQQTPLLPTYPRIFSVYVISIMVSPNIGQVATIDHDIVSPTTIRNIRTIVIHGLSLGSISCFSLKLLLLEMAAIAR
jgi:hypothetical protein